MQAYSLESLRREEVEQMEELFQVILQRCSGQQQLVLEWVVIQHPEELQRREEHIEELIQLIQGSYKRQMKFKNPSEGSMRS